MRLCIHFLHVLMMNDDIISKQPTFSHFEVVSLLLSNILEETSLPSFGSQMMEDNTRKKERNM